MRYNIIGKEFKWNEQKSGIAQHHFNRSMKKLIAINVLRKVPHISINKSHYLNTILLKKGNAKS